MSNNRRRRPPMSVAEAQAALERAQRREAEARANMHPIHAASGREYRAGQYQRPAVDLANLDTPGVTHQDQWADFLNRPGKFYVASITLALDDDAMGEKVSTTTTLKADDEQLPYLVEILRQVRGAFGAHTRIELSPAEPHVEERRIAGPVTKQGPTMTLTDEDWRDRTGQRPATADELAAIRQMRNTVDAPPWAASEEDRALNEFTREQLVAMLPGRTRREVAAELGKAPEAIGGSVRSDQLPEELADELGVPVESLRRIPMNGGGYAWTVTPPVVEHGRHAAPDESYQ